MQLSKYIEIMGAKFLTVWKVTYKHGKGKDKNSTQVLVWNWKYYYELMENIFTVECELIYEERMM